ncbi:MAG: orotate phosphoribosyltransferase [Bacteroidales bacterium]|nr:orotate phosphoribosyltransferase [Bacteroidales bacterium]
MDYNRTIAEFLLSCEAVKLSPEKPFTWASGWKSPIYCDNRKTLAFPQIRSYIRDALCNTVKKYFPSAEVVAGVATGAIAQGALVADQLNLPFCYVRSAPKDHGLENLVEGHLEKGQKVVIIEDLISTGGSSLKAVKALRNSGAEVLGMVAIFSYQFPIAEQNFELEKVTLHTLSNYNALIETAISNKYIQPHWIEVLKQWRTNPENWGK